MNKNYYYIPILGRILEEVNDPSVKPRWERLLILCENTLVYSIGGALYKYYEFLPFKQMILVVIALFLIIGPIEYVLIKKYPQRFGVHPQEEHWIKPLNVGRTMYHAFFCFILGYLIL